MSKHLVTLHGEGAEELTVMTSKTGQHDETTLVELAIKDSSDDAFCIGLTLERAAILHKVLGMVLKDEGY